MIAWWKQWSRRKDTRVFLHANVIEASSRLNAAREYFQLPQTSSETNFLVDYEEDEVITRQLETRKKNSQPPTENNHSPPLTKW